LNILTLAANAQRTSFQLGLILSRLLGLFSMRGDFLFSRVKELYREQLTEITRKPNLCF
jgi:hypothetical protein